ncbi:exonuclease/endonuclease/phosphatase family protein [Lunatibacter salilacus]|uniref:hypothetical protein n=1 Tax=Lunatibacter salilacus TaxID=2483804 RepID=UPI001F3668A8|nr:hypothetical protein [Lunatibacter salilacus]
MVRISIKSSLLLLFLANSFFNLSVSTSAQTSDQIATYNIQYENPPVESKSRSDRAPHAINLIRFYEMDILGPEEGIYNQTEYSSSEFSFPRLGTDSDQTDSKHVCSPVFYNPEKFELLEHSSFSLSTSPSKNSEDDKICSWGKFKGKDGKEFYVFNVYFDTNESEERVSSKREILEKINAINKEHLPCILTGDFNLSENTPEMMDNLELNHNIILDKSPAKKS